METAAGFSFRTQAQYKTKGFRVYEDRWQQDARLGGGAPATWTESPVAAGSTPTYPYPGKEAWKDDATYFEQDLTLYDTETGASQPRDPAVFGAPSFAAPVAFPPDGKYAVIL